MSGEGAAAAGTAAGTGTTTTGNENELPRVSKVGTIENVSDDGLLRKKIISEGEGDPAGRGAKVTVHYSLYKKENEQEPILVDKNEMDKPLTFTQGRKKVLPALDAVVETMSLGEKSRVYADAAYAFGKKGLKRKGIVSDTNIELDVEMLSFEGGEKRKPLSDMSPRELFEQALQFKEAGNALFKQVKFEKAMFQYSQCIRYANNVFYKPTTTTTNTKNIPSSSNTSESQNEGFNQAEIVENDDEDDRQQENTNSENQNNERVQQDEQEKEEDDEKDIVTVDATAGGVIVNEKDEEEQNTGSTEQMNGNVSHEEANGEDKDTETEPEPEPEIEENDDPEEEEVKSLKVTALNNLSLCLVKLEDFKQAVESATAALQLDPENSKGHYYRGRALVALGEWDRAREDLVNAAKLQPHNMGIRVEITKLDKKRKSFQNLERKQAAAMFA